MKFLDLIEKKRDGHALSAAEIEWMIANLSELPDYQLSSMLMAIFIRGMTSEERRVLTLAMRDSGQKLDFSAPISSAGPLVDKHSTGGVGDKVSLPLAPLLACLGFRVPMISGRGLGITGGTLDKLEAIPNFSTVLEADRIVQVVNEVGCVITGQTATMVPADKRLYALRDVTGTVPSIPLIASSILSKKLSEGIGALILDVKFGEAAFMKTIEDARELGQTLANMAADTGVVCAALINCMDQPLGDSAGNWLEVKESILVLEGQGCADLLEVVVACAAHLLVMTKKAADIETATAMAKECLSSGKPRAKWEEMVRAQGGDVDAMNEMMKQSSLAPYCTEIKAASAGFLDSCNARIIGEVVRDLGGGRLQQKDVVHPHVGIDQIAKAGVALKVGDVLCRIHAKSKEDGDRYAPVVLGAFKITAEPPQMQPTIRQVLHGKG